MGWIAYVRADYRDSAINESHTSLSFALKANNVSNLVLFAWALAITAILVGLERYALWLLAQYASGREEGR